MAMSRVAELISLLYVVERGLKLAAVAHFFGRERPALPARLPSVSLVQPVTRGASALYSALEARARMSYRGRVQHVMVCDEADAASQEVCRAWHARHPRLDARLVLVASPKEIASKTEKLQAGLRQADGEVICCVDDDIVLRPDALLMLVRYLYEPGAGAAFGTACYTDWSNLPSALMSTFVNSNALMTYLPGSYLAPAFTITGHIFALRRGTLEQAGAFAGLEANIADDHILAQGVKRLGLRNVQTPLVYDVENHFSTLSEYAAQVKRWFVFPRQGLVPHMTRGEQAATLAVSAGNMLPPLLCGWALFTRDRKAWWALLRALAAFDLAYTLCERLYLKRSTPLSWKPLAWAMAVLGPLQTLAALLSGDVVEWRGRRMRVRPGGDFEEVAR